ncbi:general odorant-binding protein 71 [Leptopilina boulardi]|uniref:general odorant-binding protein 71 n=1 Tax=Leptopilina boulardi TaxID=63433 RepID=UPI0021F636A7|nr:general odorant-binding protein 71 [Leptopilina boulardi]
MKICFLLFFLSFILLIHKNLALKCRTGNRQTNEQFRKVMQICRRRNSHNGRSGDYSNSDSDSNESDSNEDLFEKKILSGNINRKNSHSNKNGSNYRERFGMRQKRHDQKLNFRENNMDQRFYGDKNKILNRNRNSQNNTSYFNQEHENQKSVCVIQCFFNELNLVDQRGFPEMSSVTEIMTENIMDPELSDFVEESIYECFQYLQNNRNQDKCKFSQNLLTCLSDKGRERCDDWNDD